MRAAFLLIFLVLGCRQQMSDSLIPSNIYGGTAVGGEEWSSVVALTTHGSPFCTGVAVTSTIVVTAAHCLSGAGFSPSYTKVYVGNGSDFSVSAQYSIKNYLIHPNYAVYGAGYDLGIVELTQPLRGVTVVPMVQNTDEEDELLTTERRTVLVGFGQRENGSSGRKFKVDSRVYQVSELELVTGGNGKSACYGDSGGPAFAQLDNGEYRVVGITSRAYNYEGCGGPVIYTRIDQIRSWIYTSSGDDNFQGGQYEQAVAQYTEAIAVNPQEVSAYVYRALAYEQLGQIDLAHADLMTAIGIDGGKTALLTLVDEQHLAFAEFMLKNGVEPNPRNVDGWTPLMLMVKKENQLMIDLLFSYNADLDIKSKLGETVLMMTVKAGQVALAEQLLSLGANVDLQTNRGWTALMYAAKNGNVTLVEMLLKVGADQTLTNSFNETALMLAKVFGHTQVVALLQ